jgi:RNA polymerase sigma factor (sigma-70 family)
VAAGDSNPQPPEAPQPLDRQHRLTAVGSPHPQSDSAESRSGSPLPQFPHFPTASRLCDRHDLRVYASQFAFEDIVQQSLLNAFAALHTGKEVKHLRGWLYQIVRNTACGAAEQPTVALHESFGAGEPLERIVEQRMVAREVLAAVSNLPDRQREALVGSAWHEQPGAALAETMGLSEGALRQLVHRARGAVRTAVSAITPYPLIRSLAGGGGAPELAAGAGGAAAGGLALKVGAVALTAVLAGTALGGHAPQHRASTQIPLRSHLAVMPHGGSGAIRLSSFTPLGTAEMQRPDQSRSLTVERHADGERDASARDGHSSSSGATGGEDGGGAHGDSSPVSGAPSSGSNGGPGNSGGTPGGSGHDGGSSSGGTLTADGSTGSGSGISGGDGGSGSDGGRPAQSTAASTTQPDSGQAASVAGPSSGPTGGGGGGPGPGDGSGDGSGSSSGGSTAGAPTSTDGLAGSSQTSTSG